MKINKKEKEEEFWPRLLLDKVKEKTNVKIDWYESCTNYSIYPFVLDLSGANQNY